MEEAGRGGARRFGGGVDARGDTVTRVRGVASAPDPDRVVVWGKRSEGSLGKWGVWWWIGLGFEGGGGLCGERWAGRGGLADWAGRLASWVGWPGGLGGFFFFFC